MKALSEDEIKIESNSQKAKSPEYSGEVISEDEEDFGDMTGNSTKAGSELSNIKRIINEYKELYKSKIEEQKQKVQVDTFIYFKHVVFIRGKSLSQLCFLYFLSFFVFFDMNLV